MTSSGRDGVHIQIQPPPAAGATCGSCRSRPVTPASLLFDASLLPGSVPAAGTSVQLVMPGRRLAVLAALFYLAPLLALLLAALLAARAALPEGLVALCAFAAFGLSFALTAVLLRGRRMARLLPLLHWDHAPARICVKEVPPPQPSRAAISTP